MTKIERNIEGKEEYYTATGLHEPSNTNDQLKQVKTHKFVQADID